jgi:hypothetical protein
MEALLADRKTFTCVSCAVSRNNAVETKQRPRRHADPSTEYVVVWYTTEPRENPES